MAAPLEGFIPTPDARTRHAILVHAPAEVVFDVARHFDMASLSLVQATFWLRAKLMRSQGPPPARRPTADVAGLLQMGWALLLEEPGHLLVVGAVCQPWQADVVFTPIEAGQFARYAEPDGVKIAWTLEAEPLGPAFTRLATETRAIATDAAARSRFRRYWRWAQVGIVGIRWLVLPTIRRRAERRWRVNGTAGVSPAADAQGQ
jgi:hypothetical protein